MKRRSLALLLLAVLSLFLVALPAFAATTTVTLAWDANTEPDLAGYKLYQANAPGGPYTLVQTVGLVTTTTLPGLADGTYYWVLTAFDLAANESGYSNEVTFTGETVAPGAPRNVTIILTVRVQ